MRQNGRGDAIGVEVARLIGRSRATYQSTTNFLSRRNAIATRSRYRDDRRDGARAARGSKR